MAWIWSEDAWRKPGAARDPWGSLGAHAWTHPNSHDSLKVQCSLLQHSWSTLRPRDPAALLCGGEGRRSDGSLLLRQCERWKRHCLKHLFQYF